MGVLYRVATPRTPLSSLCLAGLPLQTCIKHEMGRWRVRGTRELRSERVRLDGTELHLLHLGKVTALLASHLLVNLRSHSHAAASAMSQNIPNTMSELK